MKTVEKYIKEHTRNCSNLLYRDYVEGFDKTVYQPWLTPDHARKAVEIAREEIIKEACEWIENNVVGYCVINDTYDVDGFIEDLKKHFEQPNCN